MSVPSIQERVKHRFFLPIDKWEVPLEFVDPQRVLDAKNTEEFFCAAVRRFPYWRISP